MRKISNLRRVQLLLQPYLTKQDLIEFYGKSATYVSKKIKEIHREAIEEGKKVLRGVVSTKSFMKFEEIDFQELLKLAKIEKEVLQNET